jgi:hypothetical protein
MTTADPTHKHDRFFFVTHWNDGQVDVSVHHNTGAPKLLHHDYSPTPASIDRLGKVMVSSGCKVFNTYVTAKHRHMCVGANWVPGGRQ